MPDLMTQDRGKFVFGIGQGEEPAGHVDVATGQGKGVGFGQVDDLESVVQVPARGVRREALAQLGEVGLEFRVIDETHLFTDYLGRLLPVLDFGFFAGQDRLGPSADGVPSAAGKACDQQEAEPQGPRPIKRATDGAPLFAPVLPGKTSTSGVEWV